MSLELSYWLETTQPVVPESLCPWPGSLLIPDDLDSKRCQQSRSEDLEHRRAATKSPNRSLGDRIATACKAGQSSTWEFLRRFDRRSENVGSTIEYAPKRWTLPQSSFRASLLCTWLRLPRGRTQVALHARRLTYPQLSRRWRIYTPR